jgi:hypothetical protein
MFCHFWLFFENSAEGLATTRSRGLRVERKRAPWKGARFVLAKTLKQGQKNTRKKSEKSEKMPKIAEMRKKVKNRTNHAGPNANPVYIPSPWYERRSQFTSFAKVSKHPNADKISQNSEDAGLVPNPTLMNSATLDTRSKSCTTQNPA